MALGTYAVLINNIVIDIIEFDVLSGEKIPVDNANLLRVGESFLPIPNIGETWNADLNQFI
jgi:hypothetical protein